MATFEKEDLWRAAQALAKDRATLEVLSRLENRFTEDWKGSLPEAHTKRDDAYHMVRAIAAFRDELTALAAEPSVTQFNHRLRRA